MEDLEDNTSSTTSTDEFYNSTIKDYTDSDENKMNDKKSTTSATSVTTQSGSEDTYNNIINDITDSDEYNIDENAYSSTSTGDTLQDSDENSDVAKKPQKKIFCPQCKTSLKRQENLKLHMKTAHVS